MITEVHKNQYMEDGYFVVDDLLPPAMFAEVEAACRRVMAGRQATSYSASDRAFIARMFTRLSLTR